MNWWRAFADRMELEAPLARRTWFGLGGSAKFLCRPRDADDLAELAARSRDAAIPFKVLGAGANVLVSDDGFDGVVVRLDDESFRRVERTTNRLRVGAGVDLMPLTRSCSELGLAGLEGLAGIPASIGGAVRMNAGGRFGEISDVVRSIDVLTPQGRIERWSKERIGFGYRHSAIHDEIVLSAELELSEDDAAVVSQRYHECFAMKMESQPIREHSAGCIFKNPQGCSAGAMIDQAGLKGTRRGGARVSERHANFIVADGGATASDVLRLIDVVRDRVKQKFATELDLEIDVWRPGGRGGAAA